MALTDPKDWDSIRVTVDGKTVKLDEAFEVFEDIFDDAEEAFKHIEHAFAGVDKDIHAKVDALKKRVVKERPDEYEYIPDEDEEDYDIYHRTIRNRRSNLHKLIIMFAVITLLVFGGLFYVVVTLESKPEVEAPSTLEETKPTEKLEKLL